MVRGFTILLAVATLCPVTAVAADSPTLLKFKSNNFEMYTTAGEKDARRTLEYFEQVRDFFMRIKSESVTTRLPVTIVAFRNLKEYKAFQPREHSAAYYIGDEHRDYIVLGGVGQENFPVATHEYVHLLVRHSGLKLPLWLNEGLAEIYSTMKPQGGRVIIGTPPENVGVPLSRFEWLPLDRLMAVSHKSAEYNEKNRTSVFYGQSWLLTHMFMLSEDYRNNFSKFVAAVASGEGHEAAAQSAFGQPLPTVYKRLKEYYGGRINGIYFDMRLQKIPISAPVPATELEYGLALARLIMLSNRMDEAKARYAALAKAHPNSWEVHEGIGTMHWRAGDLENAKVSFKTAISMKPPGWQVYWDYLRVGGREEDAVAALRIVLAANPQHVEARLMLGHELNSQQKFQEAYDTLAEIKQITPDRAAQLFLTKAFSAIKIGKKAEARTAAESAKKYARNIRETENADRLIEFLDQTDSEQTRRASLTMPPEEDRTVYLPPSSTSAGETAGADPSSPIPQPLRLKGTLEAIDCLGEQARLRIASAGAHASLLVRDPSSVQLRNSDATSVNLTCGPQKKNAQIVVTFHPVDDPKFKTTGDVATLEFLN